MQTEGEKWESSGGTGVIHRLPTWVFPHRPPAGQAGRVHQILEEALRNGGGFVAWGDNANLRERIRYAVHVGELVRVAPGLYARPDFANTYLGRVATLFRFDPDAVLVDQSAGLVHGWGREPREVTCASQRFSSRPGVQVSKRLIDPSHVVTRDGWRVTNAPLTALDLAGIYGGSAIDDALRSFVPLSELYRLYEETSRRPGRRKVLALLKDSRDEPWSEAERLAHRLLRNAGITGWRANHRVLRRDGQVAFIDIAFVDLRLGIEIDGLQFHASPVDAHADRMRDLDLALDGWHIVRLPAALVTQHPREFLAGVRELCGQRQLVVGALARAA